MRIESGKGETRVVEMEEGFEGAVGAAVVAGADEMGTDGGGSPHADALNA